MRRSPQKPDESGYYERFFSRLRTVDREPAFVGPPVLHRAGLRTALDAAPGAIARLMAHQRTMVAPVGGDDDDDDEDDDSDDAAAAFLGLKTVRKTGTC